MMTQKSNEEIYKSLSEEERNVTVTSVELTDKAFKGKTDYSAIARLNGKVVFREGEYFSTLEGLQLFVFKNGKQITAYNWKIEDVVVFDSVSRMSRNAEEGFTLYEDLYHKGIRLVFLKEHHIDTETYKKALSGSIAMTGTNVDFILKGINEYLMALAKEQIKLAFEQSEKEVADLHQRTREGLLTARLNGKQVGRKKGIGFETKKSKAAKEKIRIHCKAFGGTLDDMECMKLTGLARNTYYKYKRQIRADLTDEGKLKKEELL